MQWGAVITLYAALGCVGGGAQLLSVPVAQELGEGDRPRLHEVRSLGAALSWTLMSPSSRAAGTVNTACWAPDGIGKRCTSQGFQPFQCQGLVNAGVAYASQVGEGRQLLPAAAPAHAPTPLWVGEGAGAPGWHAPTATVSRHLPRPPQHPPHPHALAPLAPIAADRVLFRSGLWLHKMDGLHQHLLGS